MGEKLALSEQQEMKKSKINTLLEVVKGKVSEGNYDEEYNVAFNEMVEAAYELSTSLESTPVFTESVLKGAEELTPQDKEFFNHIHAVEDLINYLEDTDSNSPLEDVTLDKTFDFRVYSNRWGHYDTYKLTRNKDGWFVSFNQNKGQGKIDGSSIINKILEHDSISYPGEINGYLERTWNNGESGATYEQVQEELNQLAEWISITERNKPYTL